MDRPDLLEIHENVVLVKTREYRWYRGRNRYLKFAFSYLHFAHARFFEVDRDTTILTFLPTLCFGHSLFRWLRGGQTVFWVFDFYGENLRIYNKLADYYVSRLNRVLFLTEAMLKAYEGRVRRRNSGWHSARSKREQNSTPRASLRFKNA